MKKSFVLVAVLAVDFACFAAAIAVGESECAMVKAFRNAKTVTVKVDEFLIDGKPAPDHWIGSLKGTFGFLLDKAAHLQRVETNADLVFTYRAKVTMAAADYVPQYNPRDPGIKVATGALIAGTLRVESGGVFLGTIRFDGSRGVTSTYSITGSGNPVIAALSNTDIHKDLLSIFVAARGQEIVKPILDEYRMVTSVSTDWSGGFSAYQALFTVLAESTEPWAKEMLSVLSKDTESPSTKRLANEAIGRINLNKKPNQSSEVTQ